MEQVCKLKKEGEKRNYYFPAVLFDFNHEFQLNNDTNINV